MLSHFTILYTYIFYTYFHIISLSEFCILYVPGLRLGFNVIILMHDASAVANTANLAIFCVTVVVKI